MVHPYLENNKITYDEFDKIFEMLSIKEQYQVVNILANNGVELVEEKESTSGLADDVSQEQDFEILYDDDLFLDDFESNEKENLNEDIHEQETERNPQEILKIRKVINLSNETLIRLVQEGNAQAKQDLCIKNKGLVDQVVNHYMKIAGNKLDFEDLEQIGMLGMLKAAERFDFSMGTTFSTYATFWIKQAIVREIDDNGFTIRIPVHRMEQIFKVCRLDSRFIAISDYYERISAISKELGLSTDIVEDCLKLYHLFLRPASIDMPVGEEEEAPLGDFIPIEDEILPEDIVAQKLCREDIERAMATLSVKEQKVLRLRFGWDDGRTRTLEEVGVEFNVTRERIRQIEAKALRKMRHPSRSEKIKGYLEAP